MVQSDIQRVGQTLRRKRHKKRTLRHWLKSSLHTALEFMKVPLERNSAGCTSPRAVFPLLSYALLVVIVARLLGSLDSQARAATMETLAAARRGSPGSREAPLQMLGIPARPRRRRAPRPRYYFIERVVLSHVRTIGYRAVNVHSK